MHIRPENPDDLAAVHAVNEAAFETSAEADLVDAMRGNAEPLISLVAEVAGSVVGHILFSPMTLADQSEHLLMGLGPMSVLPDQQRRGIGSALVREGLRRCAELGCDAVIRRITRVSGSCRHRDMGSVPITMCPTRYSCSLSFGRILCEVYRDR